jgi:hypothetical protein
MGICLRLMLKPLDMKKHKFAFIGLCTLLSSCAFPVSYFGDKLAPTTSVDIFYSAHDVTRQYKVIGHLNLVNLGEDYVKAKFVEQAKKIGADAIVITGIDAIKNDQTAYINADALKYTN